MRKAKKLIAGIMLACMFIAGTGVEPSDVYAFSSLYLLALNHCRFAGNEDCQ